MYQQYHDYHLKTSVAKTLLHEDAHIFGGYVRDKLLHDIHAQKFYKKYPCTTNGDDDTNKLYTNTTVEPDLLGRLVSPNDIDCYIKDSSWKKVLNEFTLSGLVSYKLFERDPKLYLPNLNIPQGVMRHLRYRITLWSPIKIPILKRTIDHSLHHVAYKILENDINAFIKTLESKITKHTVNKIFPKVYIDVFIPVNEDDFNKYEAPFSNLDFECNGLIYTKKGIHMSQSINNSNNHNTYYTAIYNPLDYCQQFQKIIEDISNKHAIVVNTEISKQRIRKMLNKGWTVASNTFKIAPIKILNENQENEEDSCIICHENFKPFNIDPNLGPAYKLYCCEAKYHMKCMIRTCSNTGPAAIQNTKTCIMCRKRTYIDDEQYFMMNVMKEIKDLYNKRSMIPVPIPIENTLLINEIFPYLQE